MRQSKMILNKSVILLLLFIVVISSLGMKSKVNNKEEKIFSNISIESVDVGGLTKKQAINKLNKKYKIKDIKISFINKVWFIKSNEINLNFNIEDSVEEAFDYTRSDSKLENIKRIIKLEVKKPYNIQLNATYNEVKLSGEVRKINNEINIDAKNAVFQVLDTGEMKLNESKLGRVVDISLFKENIYTMINEKKIKEIELPVRTIYPKITTEDVKNINCILGQYSTSFNNSTSRGSNIHISGKDSSNVLVMPNEMYSYNKVTGARTWNKGYKSAPIIVGGRIVNGEGGGVCQVSTTIYNAALIAGMDIEEVHNHTFPSRYTSMGRDATVSYGYYDFKFINRFTHPVYVKNIVGDGCITSNIYGCSEDHEKLYITTEVKYLKEKYKVKTYRIFLDEENNIMRKELINTGEYKPH